MRLVGRLLGICRCRSWILGFVDLVFDVGLFSFNQGQGCAAASRVYVQSGIFDKFVDAFVKKVQSYTIGDPFDPSVFHGAQVSEEHFNVRHEYDACRSRSLQGRLGYTGTVYLRYLVTSELHGSPRHHSSQKIPCVMMNLSGCRTVGNAGEPNVSFCTSGLEVSPDDDRT